MTTHIEIIRKIRETSENPSQVGRRFENFSRKFLTTDPVWAAQFKSVTSYSEWAGERDQIRSDTGIDLVGELTDGEGFAAIQCKCYSEEHQIQKPDLDKFISAASKEPFTQLIFIDTTSEAWGKFAEETVAGRKNFKRIRLNDFQNSCIDWNDFETKFESEETVNFVKPKSILPHQKEAISNVVKGFESYDRGKLIMACGTGKTFTSLKIAEKITGESGNILVLVPSLALMSQTIREWHNDAEISIRAIAVCSDSQVSKAVQRRKASVDSIDANTDIDARDLAIPVTTDASELISKSRVFNSDFMNVIFCTYQSISVIEEAQSIGFFKFDLIICDEAHRTTGVKLQDEDISNFVKVHDETLIHGVKRLYMTATPRIFSEKAKEKADTVEAVLCSMDNEEQFGPVFHTLNFGKAVTEKLLTDYKVIVLAIDQAIISRSIQQRLEKDSELDLDNATKIVGCYRALQKRGEEFWSDKEPMRRAIMFCDSIKASKFVRDQFENVTVAFLESDYAKSGGGRKIDCKIEHVDGTFNSKDRDKLINWLGEKPDNSDECRILSNARCLNEGVDVPALDAILFMHPRKSQVDVVQAVGRVMRKSEGKNMGYIVLPVIIPAHKNPDEALNNNKNYDIVWSVLNALRSHDDRFDATINKYPIKGDFGGQIEVIAEVADFSKQEEDQSTKIGKTTKPTRTEIVDVDVWKQGTLFDEFTAAMQAKIVRKCGNRFYWSDWAKNIGEIAQNIIERIRALLDNDEIDREIFSNFLSEIQNGLNESISENDAIEMLAQHFVTKPVFDALFSDYEFVKKNPVSQAMQKIIQRLELKNLQSEVKTLQEFYENVKWIVKDIDSLEDRQTIIKTLYERFFKEAFTKLTDRLGIVYTPIEIVDFIVHSVNDLLKLEFGQTLGNKGIHIIDPFTGTGTFITRLLQSNLISSSELNHKYEKEIHANEIVLLAYYIAAVNIESVFNYDNKEDYTPFSGICLTDTFGSTEDKNTFSQFLEDNNSRLSRQKELDIKVIIGNPPYSARQRTENDNSKNVEYPTLDREIRTKFGGKSKAQNKNFLYDSYIRAIYWAIEKLEKSGGGIVGFVTGNGWIDGTFADGMRIYLEQKCTSIYIINLRGNVRLNFRDPLKREGENVFGQGSMTGIAITFLVRNPNSDEKGDVYYYDIGESLKSTEKLVELEKFSSIQKLIDENLFLKTQVDSNGDWLNKRDDNFKNFPVIGSKSKDISSVFVNYSAGVKTQRNAWCINSSTIRLSKNVKVLCDFYNSEVSRLKKVKLNVGISEFVNSDPRKISWSDALKTRLINGHELKFDSSCIRLVHTSPFFKQWLYFGRDLNERLYQFHKIFPEPTTENKAIVVNGVGAGVDFSAIMCNTTIELQYMSNSQAFPIYLYYVDNLESKNSNSDVTSNKFSLNLKDSNENRRVDGISNFGLTYYRNRFKNETISNSDIFHYVYGLLHSPIFKSKYASNLRKELPHIPPVKQEKDFWQFVKAGQKLGELHTNYESVTPYPVEFLKGANDVPDNVDKGRYFRVERMKLNEDMSIIYNKNITIGGIPEEAFEYVVNGRSAIWYVMNTQKVKTDKNSGITNDPNEFAIETMNDPAYPLQLLLKIITVSVDTMKIVKNLPNPEIE